MKRNPVKYALAFGCCIVWLLLGEYLGGWLNFYYTLFAIPAVFFPSIVAMILVPWTLITAALVGLSERQYKGSLLTMLLLGAFGSLPFLIGVNPYLLGVQHRVCSRWTPDQLRQMARNATGPHGMIVMLGGCGVCGHTGLRVQEPIIKDHSEEAAYLRIAPDIEVFMQN